MERMKRSGFSKPTLEQVIEKQASKRAKKLTSLKENNQNGTKPRVTPKKRSKVAKRAKLPTVKSMRNKCDALLTPIIKKMYPYCIFTGQETQVAHHAIKKSTSSALRYYLPNLIPLTHQAHLRLHCDEITWTGRLVALKGMDWWEDLEKERKRAMKIDIHYYIAEHKRLTDILNSL